jgi:PAS domain S-box-containing protein
VLAGYGLVVGALALNAWLTVANLRTIRASVRWVEHTWEVLNELEHAHVLLRDLESAKRGYLLTADPRDRRLLEEAQAGLRRSLDRLAALTADNPAQQENLGMLRELARVAVREHARAVSIRDAQGLDAAITLVRDLRSPTLMDRSRGLIAEMERVEQALLSERAEWAGSALSRTTTSFAVATGAALILLGGVMVLERRERLGRLRAAEALRRSDERLRLAVEATDLGTWDLDVTTGLLDWSGRGKLIFGVPGDAVVTYKEFLDLIHPDDRPLVVESVRRTLRGGGRGEYQNEYRVRAAGGGPERWVSSRGRVLFDPDGRAYRMIGTVLDVTERKRFEHELRDARDAAERASRAKSQFLAVLSHELRTPLNPALLEVTALLDRPDTPPALRHSLEIVHRCIELEARLVDDLLDLVRIAQGKLRHDPTVVDAHELIRAAVAVVADDVRSKGLRFELDLAAPDHHVSVDPARLQQVVWNLAANALKFTPVGGRVTVRTREAGPGRLAIEVEDTGAGIAPEMLARIFDPFQQGESTVLRRFGGLGLGLAISRGLVEAHGGTIRASSDGPGLGSTFSVELPTAPPPEPAPAPDAATHDAEPPAPGRILLVEDDPATLNVMARLLGSLGHEVTTASTLGAAVERVGDSCPFDLVISDIGLPDGSGLELMRLVSACGDTPAVALSGFGMREDVARCLDAGFRAHLTKPVDFTRLKRVIAELTAPRPERAGAGQAGST